MDGIFGGFGRAGLLASTAIVCMAAATPALAQTRTFNVPEQGASSGVSAFARQADIQILISARDARGRRTNAVRGNFSVQEGLQRLLAGTGLRAQATGAQTYSVVPTEAVAEAAGDEGAETGAGVAEILVVGSRSQNVDIARSENDPQPYVVFDREEIQRSQATNLEEFFRTRLPQNTQLNSDATGSGLTGTSSAPLGNSSQIDLRGLGAAQTLILVDGRRVVRPLQAASAIPGQGDINGIPLSAIERIEVLPSTAGGIYGGGAVGGVINIVRRRDYRGFDVRANYQGTFRGGGEMYQLEASGGFSPDQGRTQISFSGSYSDARPLYADDNDLWERGRALFYPNNANLDIIRGYTTNIRSATSANLVLDNGTPLNSRIAYIPIGYPGRVAAGDNGAAIAPNAGQYNIELSNDTQGRHASLRSDPRVWSANLNVRRSLARNLDLFADVSYSNNLARSTFSGFSVQATINANAPNNPFQQNILAVFPLMGTEQPARIERTILAYNAGLLFRPLRNWSATAEYGFSRSATRNDFVTVGLPAVRSTINALIQNGTLDILRDLNRFPIDYSPYLTPRGVSTPIVTRQEIISGRIAGTLVDLPAGPISLTALAERRVETAPVYQAETSTDLLYRPARSQSDNAVYAELSIPIFSPRQRIPLLNALEVQASVRHDRYVTRSTNPGSVTLVLPNRQIPDFQDLENRFSSTDYTVAARWSPVRGLSVRASYGTGFLPASITQLIPNADGTQSIQLFADPRRGNSTNQILPYTSRSGGRDDLLPEESRSFSAGLIFTPSFVRGLRLSADYTSIRKRNEIVAPAPGPIVANEDLFPGRVQRGPNLSTDPAGWAGPVIFIDTTLLNFASARIEALDFQADLEVDTGRLGNFHVYALATHQLKLRRQLLPNTAAYDLVDSNGGPLRWRANAGIDWRLGGWRAGWSMQYLDSYSVLFTDPSALSNNPLLVQRQGGATRIPSQSYHDLYVGYEFPGSDHPMAGMRVSLGVQNIFDHRPPVIGSQSSGYSHYGDPRLRRFSLSVARSF